LAQAALALINVGPSQPAAHAIAGPEWPFVAVLLGPVQHARQVEGQSGDRDPKRRREAGRRDLAAKAFGRLVLHRLGEFSDGASLHLEEDDLGLASDQVAAQGRGLIHDRSRDFMSRPPIRASVRSISAVRFRITRSTPACPATASPYT